MPGYPSAPLLVTVTDTLANIAPSVGNVAAYYVWLANEASGVIYGPSSKTTSGGSWSITGVPLGAYVPFYATEAVTGVAPTRWTNAGLQPYVVGPPANASVPPAGFAAWTTALGKVTAGTGIATVWGLGASIVGGGTAVTDILTQGYFAVWRAAKRLLYATHGDTFLPTQSLSWQPAAPMSVAVFTHNVSPSAWTPDGPFWCAEYTSTGSAMSSPLFTYTHPTTALGYRGRSFRIYYWRQGNQDGGTNDAGATWQWNLNGGTAQTVTLTSSNDNFIGTVDVTSATPGWTDTDGQFLRFGNQTVANCMKVIAVSSYTTTSPSAATTGIHFCWFGVNGYFNLGDLGDKSGSYPSDKIARFIGTLGGTAPYTASSTLTPPFAPDLCFIDVFDDPSGPSQVATSGTSPTFTMKRLSVDAYIHVIREICSALRAKSTGCSIVHMIPNFPVGVVSDTNTPGASPAYHLENAWHYYKDFKAISELNGHGWLNTDAEWGERATALTFMSGTNPHPTVAGMADIAARITSKLGL